MIDNFENVLESILFVSGVPIDISDIAGKLDVSKKEILATVEKLKTKYDDKSGLQILTFGTKIQLATNSNYAEQVACVLNPIRERQLTKATLETLSIVAYKQPVTRLEIEEIRGVSSDYAINILLEHKLIEIVGRKDAVGKPVLFGTTDEFLKRFDIASLNQLPDYDELVKLVVEERKKEKTSDVLYDERDVPTDEVVYDIKLDEDKTED